MKKIIIISFLILSTLLFYGFMLHQINAQSPTGSSTQSAQIEKNVQNRISLLLNKPKAYLGTITDITGTGFQIKSDLGEILQITFDKETVAFVKVDKTSSKIKFGDVAIGDYIVAMGLINNQKVLTARRILVTKQFSPTPKISVWGNITELTKTGFTFVTSDNNYLVTVTRNTKIYTGVSESRKIIKFSTVSENQTTIVVGELENSEITASIIQIIN